MSDSKSATADWPARGNYASERSKTAHPELVIDRAVREAGFSTEEIRYHALALLDLVKEYMLDGTRGPFTNGHYESYSAAKKYLEDEEPRPNR